MDNIDFDNYIDNVMINDFTIKYIQDICLLVRNERKLSLALKLDSFREGLIFYFAEHSEGLENVSPEEAAKIFFSQFLQYLFRYIIQAGKNPSYVKERLLNILANHADNFYYRTVLDQKNIVTLWVDPRTRETTLMAACSEADVEVVDKLLETLKNVFQMQVSDGMFSTELGDYLFHENRLGYSALSIVWLYGLKTIEKRLINLAEVFYGDKNTRQFQHFLFQIDSKGNSALMRAVMRGQEDLVYLIINNIGEIYEDQANQGLRQLLLHQNEKGVTVLNSAIKTDNYFLIKLFLDKAISVFYSVNTSMFKRFLLLADLKGNTPLIEASKIGNKKVIEWLFLLANENDLLGSSTLEESIRHQDSEGYTALMRVVELGRFDLARYFLNALSNIYYASSMPLGLELSQIQRIYHYFYLKNRQGYSVLQLAAKKNNWRILRLLFTTLDFILERNAKPLIATLNYQDENGMNVLTRLYREEAALRERLVNEGRDRTPEEKQISHTRRKLAKMLVRAGLRTPEENTIFSWRFIENRNTIGRVTDFFGIFCGFSRFRMKRFSSNICFFSNKDYQVSVPEDSLKIRKEALTYLIAFFTQSHLDSIQQVSMIRSGEVVSDREKKLVEIFDQEVSDYYDNHAVAILDALKSMTAPTLEEALTWNKPFILIDSGNDLLVVSQDKLFSASLLSPIELFTLDPALSHTDLKAWLDTYFSSEYTLHPFDPALLRTYPLILEGLEQPIVSDRELLLRTYQGLQGQVIQKLFLFNGVAIDLSKLSEPDFSIHYASFLQFRAEKLHELFFELNIDEKEALKRLLLHYEISVANYDNLSITENEYLTTYGSQLIDLIRTSDDVDAITPVIFLDIAIATHENFLFQESSLDPSEKVLIIDALRNLKIKLEGGKTAMYGKAALQLMVFLFPSAIRSIANKNPLELALPLGMVGVDTALRELLTQFIHHPQVLQIFSGALTNKMLVMLGETAERVPIVGSTLAVYGLIQSGKALMSAPSNDPNRPYYAHLLVNNLATVGLMGAEAATSFPFWPVLGLFIILTIDQVVTEGARVHNNVLHLHDDENHPLLKFYREFKLGLNIVSADIQIVEEQRQLFQRFLDYVDKIKNEKATDALVAVTLPAVRRRDVARPLKPHQKALGCSEVGANPYQPAVYPSQTMSCTLTHLFIDKKGDYSFELGEVRKFCEKRDPFYEEEDRSNYTLLVGSQSLDCSLGRERTFQAMAKASDENSAGILIHKHFKKMNRPGNYSVFLSIDPFHVGDYRFQLQREPNTLISHSDASLNQWLPCRFDAVDCITHITVIIARLYSIAAMDDDQRTHITINDDALRGSTGFSYPQGVQSIEYLISTTHPVCIFTNQIPEQTFAFFNENHYLKFENNFIKSEKGLEIPLSAIKKLTLELADKVWITGYYQPAADQQLIVSYLRGVSEQEQAILDVTLADRFSVSLAENTQFIDQGIELTIGGRFKNAFLQAYRYHKKARSFYHLLKPMDQIRVYPNKMGFLHLAFFDETRGEFGPLKVMSDAEPNNVQVISFVGTYEAQGQIFLSRIRMYKTTDMLWECTLEINASTANDTIHFNLATLQRKNFDKVSILKHDAMLLKRTHYFFCQTQSLPVINGHFVAYRLETYLEDWQLTLKHEKLDEETQVFLSENATEIIIESIRYQIKPVLAALFAVDTLDHSPINGKNLIAPLLVEDSFSEERLMLKNNIYTIGNISFTDLPVKTRIYFEEQALTFAYLKYRLETSPTISLLSHVLPAHRLEGRHVVESKSANVTVRERATTETWMTRVNQIVLGSVVATSTLLGGAFFMFIKRFRRPRSDMSASLANAVPLLTIPETSARLLDENQGTVLNNEFKGVDPYAFKLFKNLDGITLISSNKHASEQAWKSVNDARDLPTQLVFIDYMLRQFNKTSHKKIIHKQDKKAKGLYKAGTSISFYSHKIADNDPYQVGSSVVDVPVLLLK